MCRKKMAPRKNNKKGKGEKEKRKPLTHYTYIPLHSTSLHLHYTFTFLHSSTKPIFQDVKKTGLDKIHSIRYAPTIQALSEKEDKEEVLCAILVMEML